MIKPVSIEMMILYTLGVKLDVPLVVRCVAVVLKPSSLYVLYMVLISIMSMTAAAFIFPLKAPVRRHKPYVPHLQLVLGFFFR